MVFEEIIVNQFMQELAFPALTAAFKAITELGSPVFWFIIAAWLFWIGWERKSFIVMSIILFCGVIAGALKIIIMRPRPFETGQVVALIEETGYSMPSAHSVIASTFATYGTLSKWVQKKLKYLLVLLAIGVAISRIYLGVHYLSDVLAGILIGVIIGWAMIKAEGKINKMQFRISKIQGEFAVILLFAIMIALYFFMPGTYSAAFAVFGYFAGYAIFRHTKIDLAISKTHSKKLSFALILIGTIILGGMGYIANKNQDIFGNTLFFILGLFITIIWPLVISKLTQKRGKD